MAILHQMPPLALGVKAAAGLAFRLRWQSAGCLEDVLNLGRFSINAPKMTYFVTDKVTGFGSVMTLKLTVSGL